MTTGELPRISIKSVVRASDSQIGINTKIITKEVVTLSALASNVTTQIIPFFKTNKKWFTFDNDKGIFILTKEAPQEAIDSYKEFYKDNKG